MPFSCIFQLNNNSLSETDSVTFIKYINENFNKFHEKSEKIAEVVVNGKQGFIFSTSPCYFSKIGNLIKYDKINEKTEIAYFDADGESIPYDLPFAALKIRRSIFSYLKRKQYLTKIKVLLQNLGDFCDSLNSELASEESKIFYSNQRLELKKLIEMLKLSLVEENYIRGTIVLQEIKEILRWIGASSTKGEIAVVRPELLEKISAGIMIFQEHKYSTVNWKTI